VAGNDAILCVQPPGRNASDTREHFATLPSLHQSGRNPYKNRQGEDCSSALGGWSALTRMHCILVFDERSSDIVTIVTMCKVTIPSNTHCSDGADVVDAARSRDAKRNGTASGQEGGWLIRRPQQERLF
jgi:hypothetical protein